MRILFVISYYNIGDGTTSALYNQVKYDACLDDYLILCKNCLNVENGIKIKKYENDTQLTDILISEKFDLIHYFRGVHSNLFKKIINALKCQNIALPVFATVCQKPSFRRYMLSPYEIRHINHFVFIDKSSYSDLLMNFIKTSNKSYIYMSDNDDIVNMTGKLSQNNKSSADMIIFGRGSTLSKCPKNMFDIFDKINIPNKVFYIVGIEQEKCWVRKQASKRNDVKVFGKLNFDEWVDICNKFDICLYQLPEDCYSSIDANLGLAMLLKKPVIYYGPAAPKERFINGYDGFVANTYDEIVNIANLLGSNLEMRHLVGSNARISTIKKFSFSERMDKYHSLFRSLNSIKNNYTSVPYKYKAIYMFTKISEILLMVKKKIIF